MDTTTQVVLVIMLIVLGSTLTIVGVMFAFILKEVRQTVIKTNAILDDVSEVTDRVANTSEYAEDLVLQLRDVVTQFRSQAVNPLMTMSKAFGFMKQLFGRKEGDSDNG